MGAEEAAAVRDWSSATSRRRRIMRACRRLTIGGYVKQSDNIGLVLLSLDHVAACQCYRLLQCPCMSERYPLGTGKWGDGYQIGTDCSKYPDNDPQDVYGKNVVAVNVKRYFIA